MGVRHDPGVGSYVELFRVLDFHPENIPPQLIFPSQVDRLREVVDLLVLVESQDVGDSGVPRPDEVEVLAPLDHFEAAVLHSVHDGIIDVSSVRIKEGHKEVLDVSSPMVLLYLLHIVVLGLIVLNVGRIVEEHRRWPPLERRLQEAHGVVRSFEYTIRKSALLPLQERRADRILKEVLLDAEALLLLGLYLYEFSIEDS
mmetsp:Transcript_28921/g.43665  ORF Transcript_28921/g.43665 Transcript_28921/m.43665 type:complete len:200 (+) Transcript_28921:1303-1902(+)